MLVGVPREVKSHENRVGLTPAGVKELVQQGHTVLLERDAGAAVGFDNAQYQAAGAEVVDSAAELFAQAEMILKVKELQPDECELLRPGQLLFAYLHLAPDPEQTRRLLDSGAACIAYETVTSDGAGLPLLAPMSEVAGRMSVQAGAHHLESAQGGNGMLLGGVAGVAPAKVLVIGGGVVGINAARVAMGMGADVTLLDRDLERLKELDVIFAGRLKTVYSTADAVERYALEADLVIGAVLIPGAAAPKLITRDMVRRMKNGSVMVDVAIDQGGCFETSRPTTHQDPTYVLDGVVHYCVSNMPGGVARTSTIALTNATLPYVSRLAKWGVAAAVQEDQHLRKGLNIYAGKVTHAAVAEALGYEYVEPLVALGLA
ncbi:alanine dehydrogenase [Parahaliea sp. F7430]|uniref:Alanine dehydrogenase n=1 Tax=Sediminihaliea albiluteola TaxID=2758564 RepID=A0A7W2YJA5_9GAMM|nr:alanine dehydrogenase [Sediminihaliea albiluteola]MBA6412940.1 alanine dehydrogenase [Sediminihaliea albiluteola]